MHFKPLHFHSFIHSYSDVDIKCSSITDNQSLKLSKVYSSLIVDFHKLFGAPLSPTPRLFVVCVLHCFDANAIMNCLAEKGISLPPCAPVQQGQRGRGQPPPLPPRFRRPCRPRLVLDPPTVNLKLNCRDCGVELSARVVWTPGLYKWGF